MKRPFSLLGGIVLTASFLNLYLGSAIAVLFCIASAIFLLYQNKRSPLGLLCFVLLAIFVFSTLNTTYKQAKIEKITGEQIIDAQVVQLEEYEGYKSVTVSTKVDSLRFKAELFDVRSYNYTVGDRVVLNAKLKLPDESIKDYLNSNGVYLNGEVIEIKEITRGKGIYKGFYHIKNYIENTVINAVGYKSAAPLIALTTGNQNYFDNATDRAIKATGASHIMVVSGLHLGIICGSLIEFLKRFKAKPKTVFLAGFVAIICVLGICGFHISAIRAAIIYLVMLLGTLIKRRADSINSLGFSVYLIAVFNPFISGSTSFLLSISATFGVVYLSPKLKGICLSNNPSGRFGSFADKLSTAICVSLSALLCIMPILIFTFGYISLASVFVNILIAYAVSLALILTVLGILVSFIPLAGRIVLMIAAALGNYVMWVINLLGRSEYFVLYFDTIGKFVFSSLAIILIFTIIYTYIRKERRETEHAD